MNCFKKYDVRGIVGNELTSEIALNIGRSLAHVKSAKTAVVGCDARESSPELKQALIDGLILQGVRVYDIGLTGTEEVYFACQHLKTDLGIEITASHNPIEYNGIKFVAKDAVPFSAAEFEQVKTMAVDRKFNTVAKMGSREDYQHLPAFVEHLSSYLCLQNMRPLKLLVNAGNGVAGHVIDALEANFKARQIPIEFIKIFHEPDATFPNGIPNPMIAADRWKTTNAVIEHDADFGIAWDGDFDRCFIFDEQGRFIEGVYIVGLLAKSFLIENPGCGIVHDPRLYWNTKHIVDSHNGKLVKSLTGHAYIKDTMRKYDAVYGGEMSAHHYFKSFGYCDSGMIPWLLIVNLLCADQKKLSEIVSAMQDHFPSSGEINFSVVKTDIILDIIAQKYQYEAIKQDHFDGLNMEFENWRFNLRGSATEPLLRLNVESKGSVALVQEKVTEISLLIESQKTNDG